MKFSLLLIFSMALLKTLATPAQAQASQGQLQDLCSCPWAIEDSLMVSQNNANGTSKFQLKV